MTFNPKVSIIIPVYNGSNYLREAIDSALSQTYKNIEVIVVNDGSNDDGKTEAVALSYGDRIRYFRKENGGVSSALNLGIQEAEGEYIGWLSHDDCYMPNKVDLQIDYLREDSDRNISILFGDYEIIDENSNFVRIHKINLLEPDYLLYDLLTTWPVHGCTTLIPTSCFYEVGFFNEENKTTQDYKMWFNMLKNGYKFKYLPHVLTRFRVHSRQDSKLTLDSHYQEREDTYIQALDLFREEIRLLPYKKIASIALSLKEYKGLRQASDYALSLDKNRLLNRFLTKLEFLYIRLWPAFSLRIHKGYQTLYLITPVFIKKTLRYSIDALKKSGVEKSQ